MKFLAIALTALFSLTLTAAENNERIYSGSGSWVDMEGNEGTFDTTLTFTDITAEGDEFKTLEIKSSLAVLSGEEIIEEKEETMNWKFSDNSRFTVIEAGIEVGKGFCLESNCLYSFNMEGERGLERMIMTKENLKLQGIWISEESKGQYTGTLDRVTNEEEGNEEEGNEEEGDEEEGDEEEGDEDEDEDEDDDK